MRASLELGVWTILCCCLFDISQAQRNETSQNVSEPFITSPTVAQTTVAETSTFQTTVAETSTFQTTVAETSTFQTTVAETSTFQTNVAETSTFQTNVAETSTFTPPLTTSVEETVTSSAAAGTTESGTSEPSLTDQISDLTIKNMSVSKVTTWSITVSWSKPEGHSSFYIVQWTDRNTSMMDNVTETSTVIANLTAGVEYSITVTAVAADNRTIGEGTDVTVYTKPQVVKNMSVSEVTTWSITVSWSKPEGHSSFYMVQWTDRNTSMMDNVTETSTVIANLTAGVEYSITVTAVAADNRTIGEGTDVTVYTKPQVVKNMSVSKVTTWSITVSWSKPEGHSSFYMVQWTDRNTSMMDNVTETSTVIANLTAGVEYSITVTAVAADNRTIGEGTDVTVYTKPQVVKNMSVSKVTTWSITVSWSKPEGHSSFYMVQWTDRNTSMMDNVTETSTVIANLTAGVEYSITVTAVAADNRTIGEGTDVTVYTKPQVVKNMSVSEVTTWSITVSWSKPEGHSSFYIVQWTDRNTSMMDNVTETSTVIANLTAGVEYSITVTAVAADNRTIGEGTDVTVHTKPQVVKNMSVSEVTTWSITVSWSKPEGHSSFYMVQWTDRNTSMMDNVTETSTVIANLTAGVEYSITVTAVAADNRTIGEGTDVTVYTKPQVVKNMSVSEVTTWSITVSWSKPEGHSSFYIVQWTDRNTSMMDNVTETSTVIANLTAGVEYSITVAAVAADNRTIGEGISQASYTRPGKIEEIRVSPGLHELDFDWDKPEGRLLTFKAVLDHKDGNVTTEYSETAKVRFHKLTPGTHYALSVTPIAGDNKTEGKSTMLSTVTQPAKPENISAGNRGTDHLNISWTLPEGDADFFVVWYDERDAQTRASPQLITGLSPGRLHNVSVAAVAGHLNNTSELFTFATHPLPPKSVRVVSRTNSSMDLSWDLSPEMLGAPNIEYSVHWGGDSGRSTPDNNMTLTSLDSGKMYEIVVETIGPEKLRSSAINIRDCTKPNPVLDLRASPESNTSVKVEWAPPDYDDSYSYRIKIYKLLGPVIEEILEEKHSTVVTGLEPGTRYHISVISIFTSECTSSEVTVVSYTKPSPVSGLTALLENTTAVTLTWFSSDEYEPPCSYSVQAQASTGEVHEDSTPTQSYTFTGLTPGEAYTFTVITKVAGVQSDPEAISRQLSPAAVTLLDAAWGTTRSNVSWSVADGWVDVYAVRLYDGTPALAGEKNVSNSTLSTSFTDLAPGAVYCVKVVTVRGLLENESPDSCNFTFPNPPRNISVASRTEHSLTFVWDSPEDMSPPQDFMITTDAGVHQTRNLTWTLSGLESGSPYGISVSTVGINDSMSRVVTEQAYTKPYPVTQLRQTQINPDSVALAWNQTEHKQDYTFFVEVRNISGDVESLTVTVRSHEAKGLTSGTNYSFTVTTRTADGTAASAQTVSHFTRPYPVEALAAVAINSTALSLTWGQPVEYKAEYTYLIETSGCGEPKNQTTPDESEEISDLTPGTNCSACVYVRAANLIQGEQQCTHQYTEPERVRPRLSSRGANSSLLVSWAKPPGNVELYNIYLNGTQRNESFVHFNSSDGFYTLENLSAGRLYAVVVETQSGPHKIPSESVANATFPNPPGAITISSKTTDTIHIWWEKAPLMSEGEFLYRLEIPSKPVDNTTLTSHVFQNLESGTSYNVSVTSVGPMGFESETVRLNMVTTKPFGVRSLEARPTEGSVDLNWTEPRDHKDTYRFSVSLGNTSGTISQNETRQMEFTFKELDPGSSYYISVTTETLDGTQAAPERTSICTDASAVEFSECVAPNEKNATITWFWDKPKGRFSNFTLKFDDPTEKEVIDNYQFKKSNLKHFAKYSLEVATQSCGKPSAFVKKVCQTGITEPPVPNNSSSMLSVEDKKYNGFTVNIDPSLLNPDHGPIKNVGVVMAKRDKDVEISKMAQYLETSFQQWVKQDEAGAYLTNVINVSHSEVRGRTCRALEPLAIPVGDKSVWKGYANGLLEANTKYKYAIVLFTDLEEKGELINAQISVFAPTQFDNFVQTSQNPVLSLAVGLGLAIFFMLLVVLIGLIVFWRRSSDKKSAESENNAIGAKVSVPVPVEDYEVYYKKQKADSNCGFAAEYEDIKVVGSAQSRINAQNPENKSKNRYNNVLPYDSSRVKLSIINGNPLDDYINANYIPGYNSRKEFIAAQGPLPTTVNEFWRMIWEKNVHTLVMLTRCNEQGRVKCEQYWTSGTKHFGNITVTTTSEIPLEDWTIRDFDVKNVKTAETRSVRHFHFTAFPDHGVPETTEVLISFRHLVREHMDQYRHSPTVVHCSAGVGRTGTFIAIDRLIFQIERENVVDVFGIVYDMRMHRTLMVQTESQYVFLNQCALDIIRSRTGTNVDLIYQNTTALSIYENIELQRR